MLKSLVHRIALGIAITLLVSIPSAHAGGFGIHAGGSYVFSTDSTVTGAFGVPVAGLHYFFGKGKLRLKTYVEYQAFGLNNGVSNLNVQDVAALVVPNLALGPVHIGLGAGLGYNLNQVAISGALFSWGFTSLGFEFGRFMLEVRSQINLAAGASLAQRWYTSSVLGFNF